MNSEFEIRAMSLTARRSRQQVEDFLRMNDLRLDEVEQYFGIFRLEEEEMLAGGGLYHDIIKCVAVREDMRDEHLFNMLVSHLMSVAREAGYFSTKVYTKPKNLAIFRSLGFELIAQSPQALMMENSLSNLNKYKSYLKENVTEDQGQRHGLIVMNANPFTIGHRYLVEQAASQMDQLFVIVVKENKSLYDYRYRLEMVRQGCADISNVRVLEGSDYQISAATFPTYFLKQVTDATDEHIRLDLDVCVRHIIPALGITHRFVGSEPTDKLTARYNELMHEVLPQHGVKVIELSRLEKNGKVVSASSVRDDADLSLLYPTSVPYVIGIMASQSLREELNLSHKPGLIDPNDNGSHSDMNYATMLRSIDAIEPYLVELARLGYQAQLPTTELITSTGINAEEAMLAATDGTNTHKGAIFALGLMGVAASNCYYHLKQMVPAIIKEGIKTLAEDIPSTKDTHGAAVRQQYHVKGALDYALDGYSQLFEQWLPFFRKNLTDEHAQLRLLLHIIATLDDNNLYHRGGEALTREAQQRASGLLDDFDLAQVSQYNDWMKSHNLSPGGSADMLALTLFADKLFKDNKENIVNTLFTNTKQK